MIDLKIVPHTHIDIAWRDGASCLAEACETVDEVTGDQLKMMLSRNERQLVAMMEDGKPIGWGVVCVIQLPNYRILFVYDMSAKDAQFERFLDLLKDMAVSLGCLRIRCAATVSRARLYKMKAGFKPVHEILEVHV